MRIEMFVCDLRIVSTNGLITLPLIQMGLATSVAWTM